MRKVARSVLHALAGIGYTFRHERNFQIETFCAVVALGVAVWLGLPPVSFAVLLLVIALVLALELLNTAVERIMDILKPAVHPYVKVVKDVVAGAVLIVSLLALSIGAFLFFPYF